MMLLSTPHSLKLLKKYFSPDSPRGLRNKIKKEKQYKEKSCVPLSKKMVLASKYY